MGQTSQRRHDIDWLRVILFGLLVPFHVAIGVYWSTYGLEINPNIDDLTEKDRLEFVEENNDYSADSVTPESMFLHWMHQWRLAALFMISGMGTAFAFRRRVWKAFLRERASRLLIPMFFGAWTMGFAGQVISGDIGIDPIGMTWAFFIGIVWRSLIFWVPVFGKLVALGHLWFLWNLFLYSLILTPLFNSIRNQPEGIPARGMRYLFSIKYGMGPILVVPLVLTLSEILFKPFFPGYIGVAYEWFWFFIFFAVGFACITAQESWYSFLETKRKQVTLLALASTVAFVWIRFEQHSTGIPLVDGGWLLEEPHILHNSKTLLACLIHSFHAWYWCLVVFSWGAHFLNRPSRQLAYLNEGVYPFYIVHMPLVFAGLRISSELGLRDVPAVLLATIVTIIFCWLFFEGARRTKVSRLLFGIKANARNPPEFQIPYNN